MVSPGRDAAVPSSTDPYADIGAGTGGGEGGGGCRVT